MGLAPQGPQRRPRWPWNRDPILAHPARPDSPRLLSESVAFRSRAASRSTHGRASAILLRRRKWHWIRSA